MKSPLNSEWNNNAHNIKKCVHCKISPSGGKVETKSKLVRQLGETIDLSTFDYQSGRHQMLNANPILSPLSSQPSSSSQSMVNPFQRTSIRRPILESTMGPPSPVASGASRYSHFETEKKNKQKPKKSVVSVVWRDSWRIVQPKYLAYSYFFYISCSVILCFLLSRGLRFGLWFEKIL